MSKRLGRALRRAAVPVIEALEQRRLLSATVADFTGGNGTSSADQFQGVSGSGWATAWSQPAYDASFNSASVVSTSPLSGGGNYLAVATKATNSSGGLAGVSRAYSTANGVDTGAVHVISFDYRLDSDLSTFTNLNDRLTLFGDSAAGYGTSTTNTWVISAYGAANGNLPADHWGFQNGDQNGDSVQTFVDSGVPLVQGNVYHFTITLNPTNNTYSATITDGQSGTGHGYASGTLGYRTGNAFTSTTNTYINVADRRDSSNELTSFSLDSLTVSPAAATAPLTGTILGTSGSYNNDGNTIAKVFDGNLSTYFDGPSANGNWAGLDLGSAYTITQINYAPRSGYASRMVGGIFQGSNTADFSSGVVDLYTITTAPLAGGLTPVSISDSGTYRYVRYLSPSGSYGNIAEAQFFGNAPPSPQVPVAPSNLSALVGSVPLQINLNWTDNSANETGFKIKRSTDGVNFTTIATTAPNVTTYSDSAVTAGASYFYQVLAVNDAGDSSLSNTANATVPLTGTILGTSGSYNNLGNVIANVFDGNASTFFDGPDTSGAWVGLDLGSPAQITSIQYMPRGGWSGYATRMVGGVFQGSNIADFSSGAVDLATITTAPPLNVLTTATVSDFGSYRYVRYLNTAAGSHTDIAEAQFFGSVLQAPAAPTNLSASVISANEMDLNWTASTSPNVIGYVIYASTDGTNFTAFDEVTADQTSYQASGLTPGVNYTFQVTAEGAGGESAASNPATGATPLAPPSDLAATVSQPDQIDLVWTDNSMGTTQTMVSISTDGVNFTQLAQVPAGTSRYSAMGLTPDQAYTFKIASDYAGVQLVDPITVTAMAIGSALSANGPATINEGDTYTLTLSSTTPTDGISSPINHWLINWNDGSSVETVTGESGSTLAHSFPSGTGWADVTITAVDGLNNTFTLPTQSIDVVPAAPSNLTASVFSGNQINLTWIDNSQIEDGYTILRSDDGGDTFNPIDYIGPNTTSYSDSGLDASSSYQYQVQATGGRDGGQTSASAGSSSMTTYSGKPTFKVEAGAADTGSALLTWTYQGQDDSGFELEMQDPSLGENYHWFNSPGPVDSNGTGTATVPGLIGGNVYFFRIRADHTDGTVSDEVDGQVTIPTTPTPPAPNQTLDPPTFLGVSDLNPGGGTGWTGQMQLHAAYDSGYYTTEIASLARVDDPFHVMAEYGGGLNAYGNVFDSWQFFAVAATGSTFRGTLLTEGLTNAMDGNVFFSPPSMPFTITFPGTLPPALSIQAGPIDASGHLRVTWSSPAGMVDGQVSIYEVTRQGDAQVCSLLNPDNLPLPSAGQISVQAAAGAGSIFAVYDGANADHTVFGTSPYSNFVPLNATATTPPAAPDGLVAVVDPRNDQQVDLHWHNTPDNETGYNVLRSIEDGAYENIGQTGADGTVFKDHLPEDFTPGTALKYEVEAFNAVGMSQPATSQPVTAPVRVVFAPPPPVKGMKWELVNKLESPDGDNGEYKINPQVDPPAWIDGRWVFVIHVENVAIHISKDTLPANRPTVYGHEQKHLQSIYNALSALAQQLSGKSYAEVAKALSDKNPQNSVQPILDAANAHTLAGGPQSSTEDDPPIGGVFPPNPSK